MESFILDKDNIRIDSSDHLKVLRWHFSPRPTVAAHLEIVKRRFRERYWTLRHLRHNGFTEDDLVKVYKAMQYLVFMLCSCHSHNSPKFSGENKMALRAHRAEIDSIL